MRRRILGALVLGLMTLGCASSRSGLTVADQRCQWQTNPLGIDSTAPRLSWVLESPANGARQTAYRVVVDGDHGPLWDSGRVESSDQYAIYDGTPLRSGTHAKWNVQVWDSVGRLSDWSKPATWSMGMLAQEDWKGKWIGALESRKKKRTVGSNGYHALETKDPQSVHWVQVDLGRTVDIDSVRLHPAQPDNFQPATPGFGFPVRFRIEASNGPQFGSNHMIADHTSSDYPNPGNAIQNFDATGTRTRYIRVTPTKMYLRKDQTYCFALAEMEVISGGKNIALDCEVTAANSVERPDWSASALTDGKSPAMPSGRDANEYAAVLLRKDFSTDRAVSRATATICGLGYYELSLNGEKIGDHKLDPGFTRFDKRALYVTYDLTNAIRTGENSVNVTLGGGWYDVATRELFGFENSAWTAPPKLLFQLDLEYADGSKQSVVSDESWKCATGEIQFQCIRAGETHDMRRSNPTDWQSVKVVAAPAGQLVAQHHPPIKERYEIKVAELTEPKPGVYVFKLAENTAGWARFRASGEAGQKITLKFSELLLPDGTVSQHNRTHTFGRYQTGEFILSGNGTETFEPRFTYHGFQYVQIEGLKTKPAIDDLVGVAVHTAVDSVGEFECSNELLNAIHQTVRRTYLNNLHGHPTDCPQREKMGWLADGAVMAESGLMNFDAHEVYRKWLADMRDSQGDNGNMPDFVPTNGWGAEGKPGADMMDPWWGGATVTVPWLLYEYSGDLRVLAQQYDAMKRYVDYLGTRAKDGIITWGLGDWLEVGAGGPANRTPVPLTSTAAYAHFARLTSEAAKLLGKDDDASKYDALFQQVKKSFNARFFDPPTASYKLDSQTASAMALVCDLVPDGQRESVLASFVKNIQETRKGHISSGIAGTYYVFKALQQAGRDDLAYTMATQTDFPSWAHMLKNGGTTLWEAWDGNGSRDHPALGCLDFWLFQGIAGIRPDPSAPGFSQVIIHPGLVGDLTWAHARYNSPRGPIESRWKRSPDTFYLKVKIPPNTTARVYLPGRDPKLPKGATFLRIDTDRSVYLVPSGTYEFTSTITPSS